MAGEESDTTEPDVPDDDASESGSSDPPPEDEGTDSDGPAHGEPGDGDDRDTDEGEGLENDADAAGSEAGSAPGDTPRTDTENADPEGGDSDPDLDGERSPTETDAESADPWEPVGGPDAVESGGFEAAATDSSAGGPETDSSDGDGADSPDTEADEADTDDDHPEADEGEEGEEAEEEPTWETWFAGDEQGWEPDGEAEGEDSAGETATDPIPEETALETSDPGDDPEEFGGGIFDSRNAPDEDQEMPLTAHVEEMLKRLAVVVAVAGVVSLLTFPFADRLINIIWFGILPGTDVARPRVYGILSLLFTRIKVASLAGVIVALPVLVYQTYLFMRPGLYPHERRYYLAAIPTSLVLALVGVSFAYFIVLPTIFTYFLYYSESVATIGFALMKTFDLILLLMGYLAIVFQIPLFIMLAMMMGLVTRRWLADRRLIFWGAFLGISFIFSPDPTGMAPVIVALTMVGLFEGTLLVTRWAGR